MENKTMTEREFYTAIIDNAGVTEEMIAFATNRLARLDESNAKAAAKRAEKKAEDAPLREALINAIADAGSTASELATAIGVSTPKATALAKFCVAEGTVTVEDVKVKGGRTAKLYKRA